MEQLLSAADLAFKAEVRRFIADALPPDLAQAHRDGLHMSRERVAPWYRLLHAKNWTAPNWPRALGGPGWTAVQRYIFEGELAAADAPPLSVFGIYLVGPTLEAFGSPAQKSKYLPGILSGEAIWCQGYSEPNAGSDLASLRTTARTEEGGWVLDGQKAWTTGAHDADYMICLARTNADAAPQAGLSLFIVDMKARGVTVRPVISLEGDHHVNEVFLDGVQVDGDDLIGEVDAGWTYGKYLLGRERTNNAQVHLSKRDLARLRALAGEFGLLNGADSRHAHIARAFAEIEVELRALEISVLRVISDEEAGKKPGPQASIVKLEGSLIQQRITALALRILEVDAASLEAPEQGDRKAHEGQRWLRRHLRRRAVTIYAGASEVQRTIIAKTVLGM
ncbi:acyl-CoA dehydrogenase family protein [Variovorax sp. PDNC026]|uniref:acyl-CoA dehydrogenase family protein n=1 Tax=Variovorax sp. PDNC026 TaxID=2811425 RepID=UPI00196556BE|nr:acyl-CoA dehydrogenase family protein [Variovorax sp. PDNC026]QRY31860.1 acyl-CoA dehydrogenase family protein [Variovorax sp. PDNC026]